MSRMPRRNDFCHVAPLSVGIYWRVSSPSQSHSIPHSSAPSTLLRVLAIASVPCLVDANASTCHDTIHARLLLMALVSTAHVRSPIGAPTTSDAAKTVAAAGTMTEALNLPSCHTCRSARDLTVSPSAAMSVLPWGLDTVFWLRMSCVGHRCQVIGDGRCAAPEPRRGNGRTASLTRG